MPEEEYRTQLENEGFSDIRTHTDGPDTHYQPHTHDVTMTHIILSGHMRVTIAGEVKLYYPGDRFDVPPKIVHEAEIGGEGCTYMVGGKS